MKEVMCNGAGEMPGREGEGSFYDEMDCDPSGDGCNECPRYLDDCDGVSEDEQL